MSLFDKSNQAGQDLFSTRSKGIYTPAGARVSSTMPQTGSKIVPATSTKSNVLTSASGTNNIMPIIDNKYTTFKTITSIVRLYEYYSLTEKILELIKDYIIRVIDQNALPISGSENGGIQQDQIDKVNQDLSSIDYKNLLKSNLDKIIYYGSIAYLISEENVIDSNNQNTKKFKLSKLKSPHDVIVVSNDKSKFYLVQVVDGDENIAGNKNTNTALGNVSAKTSTRLLTDDKVLYIGSLDFELKHDNESKKILDSLFKSTKKDQKEDSNVHGTFGVEAYLKSEIDNALLDPTKITSQELNNGESIQKKSPQAFNLEEPIQKKIFKELIDHEFNLVASKPLYYSVHQKMKDFFMKDLLLYVLGVKSSIQPLVMTWGVDSNYQYTVDELMDLVSTLEGRMNKLVDIDVLNSANMDMDVLVNRILGNIRILPDLGNNIRALESKEIDDITKKLDDLLNRRMNVKDEILDSIGIPKDLFEGATNREEVLKRDERFQSMVFKFIDRIKTAIKLSACTFARLEGFGEWDPSQLEVPMLKKSGIEYIINANRLESVRDLTSTISQVLNDYQMLSQTGCVDQAQLLEFMRHQFENVGGELASLLVSQLPEQSQEQ